MLAVVMAPGTSRVVGGSHLCQKHIVAEREELGAHKIARRTPDASP